MRNVSLRILLVLSLLLSVGYAAEKLEATSLVKTNAEASAEAQQTLRAYLQLQEQLHAALLAIEKGRLDAEAAARRNAEFMQSSREESEAAARRNADMIAARLKLIEETLTTQRDREFEAIQKSNRLMLGVTGTVGGIGLLAMLFTAFCLWRALARVAQITAAFPGLSGLGSHHVASALHATDAPFVTLNGPEMSGTRLLGAIERLEKRIHNLEDAALLPHSTDTGSSTQSAFPAQSDRIQLMLAKGQALLDANEPAEALACFEEALQTNPEHAEGLVKKGTALERLKRLEEAIQCYDKAISVNESMTVAYLHKGALYNQLERFNEALECYEQALRTQQKSATA